MIYKFTSTKEVIAKVMADLDLDEKSVRYSDMNEWASEAVEKIGSVRQLKRKISGVDKTPVITISGYQAKLPTDLFRLDTVAFSTSPTGPWFPMIISNGSFNLWSDTAANGESDTDYVVATETIVSLVQQLYSYTRQQALELLNTDYNIRVILTNLIKAGETNQTINDYGLKYTIKPGYICTSMRSGYLKISYDAHYVDSDGYLMVPDNISYIEAIYWYIVKKLKYPEYLAGRLNRETYYDIQRSWNYYCKQAYGESLMPNGDEMEAISNEWNKMIPEINSNMEFHKSVGTRQTLRNFNMI